MTALLLRSPRGGGLLSWTAAALVATPLILALSLAAGCSAARPKPIDLEAIDDSFRPALAELQNAINARDNETAARILAGILARNPEGDTLAAARRFENVLRGRELVASLGLSLDTEGIPGQVGERRLVLRSASTAVVPVELELDAALLRHRVVALSPGGDERIAAASQTTAALANALVPPAGQPGLELELARYPLRSPGAIAARDGWQLEIYPGVIRSGGQEYQADELLVEPTDRVLLAKELPKGLLDEQPLLDFLGNPTVFELDPREFNPPLLERTVRIAEQHQQATLEALAELARDLGDEQVAMLEPCLRWLLRVSEESYGPAEWRTLLTRAAANDETEDFGRLELPDPARSQP